VYCTVLDAILGTTPLWYLACKRPWLVQEYASLFLLPGARCPACADRDPPPSVGIARHATPHYTTLSQPFIRAFVSLGQRPPVSRYPRMTSDTTFQMPSTRGHNDKTKLPKPSFQALPCPTFSIFCLILVLPHGVLPLSRLGTGPCCLSLLALVLAAFLSRYISSLICPPPYRPPTSTAPITRPHLY
jgi:hypothetical protein